MFGSNDLRFQGRLQLAEAKVDIWAASRTLFPLSFPSTLAWTAARMAVAKPDEKKKEWGAEMDYPSDEELPDFPSRHETEVDVNGVKTVTTYRTDETGAKYKCMRTVKVTKKTTRVHKSVLDRRKWAKFGQSELVELKQPGFHGPGFTNGFTQLDNADQQLEMTPKARVAEENNEAAARAFEKMNVGTFEAWRPKNRGDVAGDAAEWAAAQGITGGDKFGGGGGGGGGGLAGLVAQQEAGGATGSGYVPPSMRNADGTRNESLAGAMPVCAMRRRTPQPLHPQPPAPLRPRHLLTARTPGQLQERDDSCTVRVSNLSEDVKDSDLRELFRRFGMCIVVHGMIMVHACALARAWACASPSAASVRRSVA